MAIRGGSLTRRLLVVLISSLTVVAVVLGVGGAWFSKGVAEQTADRVLQASARAIAETLAVEDGEITLDLPPAALGMLEDDARDNIYYNISLGNRLVTGYPDFPAPPSAALDPDFTYFRYDQYRGVRVRVATEVRHLPRISTLVVVQVAETLTARQALEYRLLLAIAGLEVIFIVMAGLLVWPAVGWSLRPVTRLRSGLEARSSSDFTPIDIKGVPGELVGLVSAFNALLGRLEGAVGALRRFTADASHQMRTPLAILRTHVAALKHHGPNSPEGQASLDDIDAAAERLKRLLAQLIALARAEEGAAEASPLGSIDLSKIAAEATRQLAPAAMAAGVDIHFEAPDKAVRAVGARVFVEEIITNLVENAVSYNARGGTVTVRVMAEGDEAILEIEDDGPGIPPKDREAVFQRFHRLSRDRDRAGSGLGLPIVRTLADALGAQLSLASGADGKGLKVTVNLKSARSSTSRSRAATA